MCRDQGYIQAYIDKELPAMEMDEFREHLDQCAECRAAYQRLLDNELLVRSSMEGMLASDRERFNAELAWQKLKLGQGGKEANKPKGVFNSMRIRRFFTVAAAAAALVALFSFSPVRTMAGDFLTVFRVEKVSAVAITPEDMKQLEKVMREGAGLAEVKNFGRVEVSGRQEVRPVTLQEARQAVDFELKLPSLQGYGKPELQLTPDTSVSLSLDVGKVNSVLQALGSGERLPAELDGREFKLVAPAGITARYKGAAGSVLLIQSRGPSVQTSSGVDVNAIRRALLSIPGLPENLKNQLAAVEDWQHTALIPVKAGQYSEVKVNGSGGVFVQGPPDAKGGASSNALVWQKSGVIYVLAGQVLNLNTALNIAGGMK